VVQQGPPPSRSGRPPAGRPRRDWSNGDYADDEEEYPPWAGPGTGPRWADHDERERRRLRGQPERPAGPARPAGKESRSRRPAADPADGPGRGGRGRTGARARRARRAKTFVWAGALVAVLVIAAGIGYELSRPPTTPRPASPSLVTTFLPGEFRTVPKACTAVTAATLNQYLPGKPRVVVPKSLYGNEQSLCDWTLDARPRYRVLEVTVQAYAPSALASGDGSATFAAEDAYAQARQQKAHPAKATHLPKAVVSQLPGLGSSAFAALQVPQAGGDPTNLLTVVVRDRNVLITVVSQGPARARGGYAAVSAPVLQGAAVAAARDILTQLPGH
jgi:hypothetical protein